MGFESPAERASRRNRALIRAAVVVFVVAATLVLDRWLFGLTRVDDPASLERKDWYRLLRVMGYWPTWLAAAAIVELSPRTGPGAGPTGGGAWWHRPAVNAALSAGVAGLLAELGKVLVSKERPGPEGLHVFRGPLSALWTEPVYGWGMPSSHAAVAFGAAWAIARWSPRGGAVAVALAAGCGLTRMLSGAHFASDVVAGAAIGLGAAWLVSPGRRRGVS